MRFTRGHPMFLLAFYTGMPAVSVHLSGRLLTRGQPPADMGALLQEIANSGDVREPVRSEAERLQLFLGELDRERHEEPADRGWWNWADERPQAFRPHVHRVAQFSFEPPPV